MRRIDLSNDVYRELVDLTNGSETVIDTSKFPGDMAFIVSNDGTDTKFTIKESDTIDATGKLENEVEMTADKIKVDLSQNILNSTNKIAIIGIKQGAPKRYMKLTTTGTNINAIYEQLI